MASNITCRSICYGLLSHKILVVSKFVRGTSAMAVLAWHAYVQRSATAHPKQPGGAPTVGILRTCSLHLVSPICFPQIISWKCSQCAIGSSSELLATTTSSSTGNCWRGLFHAWASQERVLATNRITFRKRELPGASIGASSRDSTDTGSGEFSWVMRALFHACHGQWPALPAGEQLPKTDGRNEMQATAIELYYLIFGWYRHQPDVAPPKAHHDLSDS